MPSSTSSSDVPGPGPCLPPVKPQPGELPSHETPPVDAPIRTLPSRTLGAMWLVALLVFAVSLLGWELYWRSQGFEPGYRNSEGLWAIQRRRIDQGEGNALVLLGSSRVLFDVQLPVWERMTGERPIQLALEGTSPMSALEDLAADQDFHGRVLVGVSPDLFFSGFEYRGQVLEHYRNQSPAQRSGQWLSMHLLEPWLAYYSDEDTALFTVLARQPWPPRGGVMSYMEVRKLAVHEADRNTRMWRRVETDPQYRALARSIWAQRFNAPPPPPMATPELARAVVERQIQRAVAAVATLRARGVPVVFVRPPSAGEYLAFEQRVLPRDRSWDPLLAATGAPGIHFEDHPGMQGLTLPEWSHLAGTDADRFTAVLVDVLRRERWLQPDLDTRAN